MDKAKGESGQKDVFEGGAEGLQIAGQKAVDHQEASDAGGHLKRGINAPTAGEPTKVAIKQQDHQQAQPEGGGGDADHGDHTHKVVNWFVFPHGGGHAQRDAQCGGEQQRGQRQLQCGREEDTQVLEHRTTGADRGAKVALDHAFEVADVLDR